MKDPQLTELYIWGGWHWKSVEQIKVIAAKRHPGVKVDEKQALQGICEGQRLKKMGGVQHDAERCPVCLHQAGRNA